MNTSQFVVSRGDSFFVPLLNTYNILNMLCTRLGEERNYFFNCSSDIFTRYKRDLVAKMKILKSYISSSGHHCILELSRGVVFEYSYKQVAKMRHKDKNEVALDGDIHTLQVPMIIN